MTDTPAITHYEGEPEDRTSDIIQAATGTALEEFARRHPATYRALIKRIENPMEFIMKALKQDAAYVALVKQTESELDIAEVTKVLIGVAFHLAESLMFGVV